VRTESKKDATTEFSGNPGYLENRVACYFELFHASTHVRKTLQVPEPEIITPTQKRTEGPAPVCGSKFTTKVSHHRGDSADIAAGLNEICGLEPAWLCVVQPFPLEQLSLSETAIGPLRISLLGRITAEKNILLRRRREV
jgi:hypothetical protein